MHISEYIWWEMEERNSRHVQNLTWQHHIIFGNPLELNNTKTHTGVSFFSHYLWSHNAQAEKMSNNKRGKPRFITCFAALCNVMQFKSQAPLNTLLHGRDPKQKSPSLYPWRHNPNGPLFWWRGGKQKQSLLLTGSLMMSSDVGVCSRAAGKLKRGCLQYHWFL